MDKKHGYIQYYLNAQKRHDAEQLVSKTSGMEWMIEEFALGGYRVAFNYDDRNAAMRVTVTTPDPESPNKHYILSEFARSLETALAWAYYYHFEVCSKGDWMDHATGFSPFKEFAGKYSK